MGSRFVAAVGFVLVAQLPTTALAGPFGLEMGMTWVELGNPKALGKGMYALDVPKPHSTFERYAGQVGPRSGLCWIKAMGRPLDTNSYGSNVKAAFEDIKRRLEATYGAPEVFDRLLPGSTLRDSKDWMKGLQKRERLFHAKWDGSKTPLPSNLGSIFLYAYANSSDAGGVAIEYSFANEKECERETTAAEDKAL
jgi:hypothetical protein